MGVVARRHLAHQGVAALPGRHQLQARTPQQCHEALFDSVLTGKPIAAVPGQQRRVDRQADPGLAGKAGQRDGQAASRHLVTAPRRIVSPGHPRQTQGE